MRYTSPLEVACNLPTFAISELATSLLAAQCLVHALRTRQLGLFASAVLSSALAGKSEGEAVSHATGFLQHNGTPLSTVSLSAASLYTSAVAAGAFSPLPVQLLVAFLLSHRLSTAARENGSRFLWYTGSPLALEPALHASAFTLAHALVCDPRTEGALLVAVDSVLLPSLSVFLSRVAGMSSASYAEWERGIRAAAALLNAAHAKLLAQPDSGVKSLLATAAMTMCCGRLLRAAPRVRAALLSRSWAALAFAVVFGALRPSRQGQGTLRLQEANHGLFRAVCVFYAVQATLAVLGAPRAHLSTAAHRPCDAAEPLDARFQCAFDRAGNSVVLQSEHKDVYTLVGSAESRKDAWRKQVLVLSACALGAAGAGRALLLVGQ